GTYPGLGPRSQLNRPWNDGSSFQRLQGEMERLMRAALTPQCQLNASKVNSLKLKRGCLVRTGGLSPEGLQARNPLRSAHCHVNAIQQEMQRALGYTRRGRPTVLDHSCALPQGDGGGGRRPPPRLAGGPIVLATGGRLLGSEPQ